MSKKSGPKTSKSKPIQTRDCEIKTELIDDLTMMDTDKIMLEIVCEKLMDNLDALFKRMGTDQQKSTYLDTYGRKKELLESLIYSNEQKSDHLLNQIENKIVNKSIFKVGILNAFSHLYKFLRF